MTSTHSTATDISITFRAKGRTFAKSYKSLGDARYAVRWYGAGSVISASGADLDTLFETAQPLSPVAAAKSAVETAKKRFLHAASHLRAIRSNRRDRAKWEREAFAAAMKAEDELMAAEDALKALKKGAK